MNRPSDETSRALLDAAHRLLATEGPDALTVRRIAAEAGMSTMNVYSRFGGKDGVIDELYVDGFERLFAAIEAVPTNGDPIEDLVAVATAYRRFALANPRYYAIMFAKWPREREVEHGGRAGLTSFIERLRQASERDGFGLADGLDVQTAAVWMWASCHGMVSLELNEKAGDRVDDWEHVFVKSARAMVRSAVQVRQPVVDHH